ncbi:MAG TPA: SMP-30/gluconolactonase/LRE family protein [Euzebya sp.]|nr:SMP-30/gluconolactonase/LRE family protein [Euzebya sp.]
MTSVTPLTPAVAHHGEGPIWDHDGQALLWVDMLAGDVLRRDAQGQITRHHIAPAVAALRPRRDGGWVVATGHGFTLLDDALEEEGARVTVLMPVDVRMNDGGCDPLGRFFCGTMATEATAHLYRLDPDMTVHTVLSGVTISNGLGWSPDGAHAYYIDSQTQRIDTFDVTSEGALVDRRPLVAIPASVGTPDGLTVAADGGLWVALWGGGAVHHYNAAGTLQDIIEVPVRQVTACTFGGPDLQTLHITTSRKDLEDPEPLAGAVFTCRPGATGLPAATFNG